VNEIEVCRLLTHAPFTLADVPPDHPQSIDVELLPIAGRVRGGHRIALVIDTVDKRYTSASVVGSTVTITSSAANLSYAILPTPLPSP
jgi:X-Pro dipeptidyl-peptidase C-terminal non-catalytic domain